MKETKEIKGNVLFFLFLNFYLIVFFLQCVILDRILLFFLIV